MQREQVGEQGSMFQTDGAVASDQTDDTFGDHILYMDFCTYSSPVDLLLGLHFGLPSTTYRQHCLYLDLSIYPTSMGSSGASQSNHFVAERWVIPIHPIDLCNFFS